MVFFVILGGYDKGFYGIAVTDNERAFRHFKVHLSNFNISQLELSV